MSAGLVWLAMPTHALIKLPGFPRHQQLAPPQPGSAAMNQTVSGRAPWALQPSSAACARAAKPACARAAWGLARRAPGRMPARRQSRPSGGVQVAAAWGQLRFLDEPNEPDAKFRSLFSAEWIPPSNNPASVYDARDALEACSGLWGDDRQECLSVFGLDVHQVDTFYADVFALEQALSQDTDPEEEAYHRGQERC